MKVVRDYLKKLPLKVEEAILFGSSSEENRLWDSDIDLIVISPDFEKMHFVERLALLQKHWNHRLLLEAFGYTRGEFEEGRKKSILLSEADARGFRVH